MYTSSLKILVKYRKAQQHLPGIMVERLKEGYTCTNNLISATDNRHTDKYVLTQISTSYRYGPTNTNTHTEVLYTRVQTNTNICDIYKNNQDTKRIDVCTHISWYTYKNMPAYVCTWYVYQHTTHVSYLYRQTYTEKQPRTQTDKRTPTHVTTCQHPNPPKKKKHRLYHSDSHKHTTSSICDT